MENRMNDRLIEAINEIANLSNDEKTNIKGKFYTTVDKRLQTFRKHFGADARVSTEVIHHDLERVVVKASVSVYVNETWSEIGNDFAEEFRASGMVNKTSALENCCTSAIGRALASCGLGGGEYASGFEVDNAINRKPSAPVQKTQPALAEIIDNIEGALWTSKLKVINTKSGFLYRNHQDDTVVADATPVNYIQSLRTAMTDASEEERKSIFKINSQEIERAYLSIEDKDVSLKESYEKMIDLYHD
jgi:hypothetical protein